MVTRVTVRGFRLVAALAVWSVFGLVATSALRAQEPTEFAGYTVSPAAVSGMIPTSMTAGYVDPNGKVPTVNAVPGSGVENVDLSFPTALLVHGVRYVYATTVQDNNYTGSCTVSFKLTQVHAGKTVVLDSGTINTFSTKPGNVWLWVILGKAIPNSPGPATLTATYRYGAVKTSMNSLVLLQ